MVERVTWMEEKVLLDQEVDTCQSKSGAHNLADAELTTDYPAKFKNMPLMFEDQSNSLLEHISKTDTNIRQALSGWARVQNFMVSVLPECEKKIDIVTFGVALVLTFGLVGAEGVTLKLSPFLSSIPFISYNRYFQITMYKGS